MSVLSPRSGVAARAEERAVFEVSDGGVSVRRRRANVAGGRRLRHEVKVSVEEEARLVLLAAGLGVSVPRLLVESALASERGVTVSERRDALAALLAAHRLLARVSTNVNQLARVANATGAVGAELSATLEAVRRVSGRLDVAVEGLGLS